MSRELGVSSEWNLKDGTPCIALPRLHPCTVQTKCEQNALCIVVEANLQLIPVDTYHHPHSSQLSNPKILLRSKGRYVQGVLNVYMKNSTNRALLKNSS